MTPSKLYTKLPSGRYRIASIDEVQEEVTQYMNSLVKGQTLGSPQETSKFLLTTLAAYTHEVFACLFMDSRHRVISLDVMFHGTIDGASVHPREVVRRALEHNAASLILTHNHPSGAEEPSRADRSITKRIQEAMALIDVRVLDHIVVGHNSTVSFADRGWL